MNVAARRPASSSACMRGVRGPYRPASTSGSSMVCRPVKQHRVACRSSQQENGSGPSPLSSVDSNAPSSPLASTDDQWSAHYGEADSTSPVNGGMAAGAAIALALALAAGPLLGGGPSLAQLEQKSVPLEVALSNKKPTVIEFYASWCEVCKDLVPDETRVQERYGSDINFVMLNIDNSRWAPEMAEYGVGGVPHFVFMDGNNEPLAAAVGRLPRKVLEGNVSALAAGEELPFLKAFGEVSQPDDREPRRQANPRDHA